MGATAADAHAAEVEAWRQERYARLRQPMSWLSLAALEWLHEGENTVGSSPDADLRLATGPPIAGRLVRGGRRVTAHGSSELTSGGRGVDGLELVSDVDAPDDGDPTPLELGSLRMCLIRRGERLGLRAWDVDAPALRDFAGVPHFPVDPGWRLVARFEPAAPGATLAVPDVLGEIEDQPHPGTVAFERDGTTHRVRAVEGGEGRLWLIFADETSGRTTYGGGRYLYTDPPDPDGAVIVDFNRAYNPPCVFSPYATCPLPPPENHLPLRIEAGELLVP